MPTETLHFHPALQNFQGEYMESILGLSNDEQRDPDSPRDSNGEEEDTLRLGEDAQSLEMANQWQQVLKNTDFPLHYKQKTPQIWKIDLALSGGKRSSLHRRSNSDVVLGMEDLSVDDKLSGLGNGIRKSASVSYSSGAKLASNTATLESLFSSLESEPVSARIRNKTVPSSRSKSPRSAEADNSLFSSFSKGRVSSKPSAGLSPLSRSKTGKYATPTFTLHNIQNPGSLSQRERPPLPLSGSLRSKSISPRLNVSNLPSPLSPELSPRNLTPSPKEKSRSPATTPTTAAAAPAAFPSPKLTKPKPYTRIRDWHKLSMDSRQAEELLKRVRIPPSSSAKSEMSVEAILGLEDNATDAEEDSELVPELDTVVAIPQANNQQGDLPLQLGDVLKEVNNTVAEQGISHAEEVSKKSVLANWHLQKAKQMVEQQPVTLVEIPQLINESSSAGSANREGEKSEVVNKSTQSNQVKPSPQLTHSASRGEQKPPLDEDTSLLSDDPDVKAGIDAALKNSDFGPLMEAAQGASSLKVRAVVAAIRSLTRQRDASENRQQMGSPEGLSFLMSLLTSDDPETVEHAVTVLLNLSLEEEIKDRVFSLDCVKSLVKVLRRGSQVAQENAAATLYLFTNVEGRQAIVGEQDDAIPGLLDLLRSGSLRGQKDAALALFNLSLNQANRKKIVALEGVPLFLKLLRDGGDLALEEKVMALIEKAAKEQDGRMQIVLDEEGISTLVECLQSHSDYCRTEAVSTLLILARKDPEVETMIEQEGPRPTLNKLALTGSDRLRKKAKELYERLKARSSSSDQGSGEGAF